MSISGLEKLTAKEREALRLVHRRLTSKEIAPLLGIRVDAVDARIKNATRKLGLSDRGKAALLLADHEAEKPYQQQVYQPPEIAADGATAMIAEPVQPSLQEDIAPFHVGPALAADASAPVNMEENSRVRLSSWERLGVIVAVAIGTIIAMGLLISALNGLVQLAQTNGRLF